MAATDETHGEEVKPEVEPLDETLGEDAVTTSETTEQHAEELAEEFEEEQDDEFEDDEHIELTTCPGCLSKQPHERLNEKPRGSGIDVLVRCEGCGKVHTVELRPPGQIIISFTLSDGALSEAAGISADEDEELRVKDVFDHDDGLWRITRMDDAEGRGMRRARADEIASAWAVRCDEMRIKLTMTVDDFSRSKRIQCEPDRVFSCGSIMEVDGLKWRIRAIHTGIGRTLTGKRPASQIRRIFLHPPPDRDDRGDRRGRRPRGAMHHGDDRGRGGGRHDDARGRHQGGRGGDEGHRQRGRWDAQRDRRDDRERRHRNG